MKRFFSITLAFLLALSLQAKNPITTFLGIPVGGTKSEMISKLKEKGVLTEAGSEMRCSISGVPYIVKIMTDKNKVYRISLTEVAGTDDVCKAVAKYNELIEQFRNNDRKYTEYESNDLIHECDSPKYRHYIHEGWCYAEFFQVSDPQLYSKRVSFKISDEYGDFRIVRCYDNIYNMPKGLN